MADQARLWPLHPSVPFESGSIDSHGIDSSMASLPSIVSTSRPLSSMNASSSHLLSNRPSTSTMDPRLSVNNLLSPPEPILLDNFEHAAMLSQKKPMFPKSIALAFQPLSPPISPPTKPGRPDERSVTLRDPFLYPPHDISIRADSPLFEEDKEKLINEHITSGHLDKATQPSRADYELALEFRSQVFRLFNKDQEAWRRREMGFLREDERIRKQHRLKEVTTLSPYTAKTTPVKISRAAPRPKVATATIRKPREAATPRVRHSSGTPQPGHSRASHGSTREDRDFNSVPDYCPPVYLPHRPNSLKVEWKGAPIDLSGDPHVHLLHPDEVALAANLRLDCATYLTSKRRIFDARVACLKRGKEFRKTDSQQACKIDVNKASKLWQAFEKVGWLRAELFQQFA